MESARLRFLFTGLEGSENERVSKANEEVFLYVSTNEQIFFSMLFVYFFGTQICLINFAGEKFAS